MKIDWIFWLLLIIGLSLVGVGGIYWFDPDIMYGLYGADPGGKMEHHLERTGFGGLHVAIGMGLLAGAATPRLRPAALSLQMIYLAGIVFGRVGSFIFDGVPASPVIMPEFVVESLLLLVTIRLHRSAQL
ncbi:DUF4345 family protein [Novosphingobium sp. BL-52-GroH]|uniref:DUF4345 family protein n=1 Tax=Novosphingobium sp. BL-52-GroH TaxID=3349877 RepID=UPI003850D096